MGDQATASHNHPPHRESRLGILFQRRIAHLLFDFETSGSGLGIIRHGFVNVGSHSQDEWLHLARLRGFANSFGLTSWAKTWQRPNDLHKLIVNLATCIPFLVRTLVGVSTLYFVAEARAQDALIITTNSFNISGATERELRRSISQSRPWKDKREGDANTEWKIEWTFRLRSSERACQLDSFATKTTITMTLPKWMPRPAVPELLTQRWESYLTALKTHEDGHKKIALAAVAEIQRRVKMLKPQPTCEDFSELLNGTARSVIAEYRQKEIEYDRQTDHGATQGARFP